MGKTNSRLVFQSRVKLFDDSETYIHSVKADGTGGLIEYVAAFPNMTVNSGDEYKVCALTIKDSNLICETGINSPAPTIVAIIPIRNKMIATMMPAKEPK